VFWFISVYFNIRNTLPKYDLNSWDTLYICVSFSFLILCVQCLHVRKFHPFYLTWCFNILLKPIPVAARSKGFESRRGHRCLSGACVVCCQVVGPQGRNDVGPSSLDCSQPSLNLHTALYPKYHFVLSTYFFGQSPG